MPCYIGDLRRDPNLENYPNAATVTSHPNFGTSTTSHDPSDGVMGCTPWQTILTYFCSLHSFRLSSRAVRLWIRGLAVNSTVCKSRADITGRLTGIY